MIDGDLPSETNLINTDMSWIQTKNLEVCSSVLKSLYYVNVRVILIVEVDVLILVVVLLILLLLLLLLLVLIVEVVIAAAAVQ